VKQIILTSLIILCIGCVTNFPRGKKEGTCIISMEKTYCSGFCPVYSLKIYSNGNVMFNGKENFTLIGTYKTFLSRHQLKQLRDAFKQANFFALQDSYLSLLKDLPTTYISFSDQGQTKKITDYQGAPESLKELELQLEQLIGELKWEKQKE
jgi:hypothetical protein